MLTPVPVVTIECLVEVTLGWCLSNRDGKSRGTRGSPGTLRSLVRPNLVGGKLTSMVTVPLNRVCR